MSKNKPMLGALSVIGKDREKRKLILPTSSPKIIKDTSIRSRIYKFFDRFRKRNKPAFRYRRITVRDCKNICNEYFHTIVNKPINK